MSPKQVIDPNTKELKYTRISPWGHTLCPMCFKRFHLSECEAVATKEAKDEAGNVIAQENQVIQTAPTGFEALLRKFRIKPLLGPEYVVVRARWKCPKCSKPLPKNIELFTGRIIAILGKPTSGKSSYITALIRQLNSQSLRRAAATSASFEAISSDIDERYYKDFHDPLFVRKEQLSPTKLGIDNPVPLIYRITVGTKSLNLLFYDVSGEDIEDAERRDQVCRYIFNSDGLIYLVDPMNIPSIRDTVPQFRDRPPAGKPEHQVLKSILSSYRDWVKMAPNTKIQIPCVITVAKCDLLRYLPEAKLPQATFMKPANYEDGLNMEEINVVSGEVEQLLQKYDEAIWNMSTESFEKVKYSAVSATGEAPDSRTLLFHDVRPQRCLDPLLWILSQIGMLQADQPHG